MQEDERVPHLLERVDLTRFTLKDHRNFDDCQYRAPGLSSRLSGKTFEVTYSHSFPQDLLITHIDFELSNREAFAQLFEVGDIEASKLTNRGTLGPVIRSSSSKSSREEKSLTVPCVSITQSLKVSLLLKKQFTVLFNDSLALKREKGRLVSEENVAKMIQHTIKAISVCGYHLSMNTAASELVPLLNISQAFKHSSRLDEAAETDILVSLSLISARRFVQAAECLRRVSKFYVEKYISSKSSMDFSRIDKSWIKEDNREPMDVSAFSRTFVAGRVLEGGRYLYKAAKIELLLADTINQPTLLGEKLDAYNRANSFANGNVTPDRIQMRIDYEQVAYTIGPSILPFLVKVLTDKSEIYKVSTLKSIEFFFQTLGCTLGNFMPLIIKTLITIYPSLRDREESVLKTEENLVERSQSSTRTKLLLDHTHHLLESLLSLLPGMNKRCLKVMFEDILEASVSEDYPNELRLYLLRFGQRVLQICGPDLEISVGYIRHILAITDSKFSQKSEPSKHITHNLVYFAQRIFDLLKTKILRQYNKTAGLGAITNWVNDSLISLCENETLTSSPQLQHTLDLVVAIYASPRLPLPNPIEPIIYLLNTSLNEPKLPFDKILEAFIVLIKHASRHEKSELGSEIVERVLGRSRLSTLGAKELRILERVVQTAKVVKVGWLQQFLQCIPHSNFDEVYAIFDLLVQKCIPQLNKQRILMIINTLFNQYTVKGKAHHQSKEHFIVSLLGQLPGALQLLLEICLFDNKEPQIQHYLSRTGGEKERGVDSKLFRLRSQLFGEKINLLVLVFSKGELVSDKFQALLDSPTIHQFYLSSQQVLLHSRNFKIKSKFLLLLKHLILLLGLLPNDSPLATPKIFFARVLLQLLGTFTNDYRDSKLQYCALLNIGLLFQKLFSPDPSSPSFPSSSYPSLTLEHSLAIFDQLITPNFKLAYPLQFSLESMAGHELLKIWNNLLALLNSPLESVREILMLVVLQVCRRGLQGVHPLIKTKLVDHLRPLLASCLSSNEHSQRLMAVRLLALLFGFGQSYPNQLKLPKHIQPNVRPLRNFLQIAIALEDDWHEDIAYCSALICKICVRDQLRVMVRKKNKSGKKYSSFMEGSNISFNLQEELNLDKKHSFDTLNNFEAMLKAEDEFNPDESFEMPAFRVEWGKDLEEFRLQIEKINFMESMGERDSFVEEEQQYYDPNEERNSDQDNEASNRSEDELLEFEDLGIIEIEDEEWGEEENEVRITQKLPLKKVYKLSPNLASSTKHRLRNKRLHPTEFEEDRIIVDELEGRINIPPAELVVPKSRTLRAEPISEKQDLRGRLEVEDMDMAEMKGQLKRQIGQLRGQAANERRNEGRGQFLGEDLLVVESRTGSSRKKAGKKRKTSTGR